MCGLGLLYSPNQPVLRTMAYNTEVIPHVRSVLKNIMDVLLSKEEWFSFTSKSSDGRNNSQQDEPQVAEFLLHHPSLSGLLVKKSTTKATKKKSGDEEDNRAFGDIGIDISKFGYTEPFPCNIKIISEKTNSGNNSCGATKLIGYTFSKKCSNHNEIMKIIISLDKDGYNDVIPLLYGLIMVYKESKRCWTGTLDEVPEDCISTNPSNPLQVSSFTERVSRTSKEYITLLKEKLITYYKKKSEPLAMWSEYQLSKTAQ